MVYCWLLDRQIDQQNGIQNPKQTYISRGTDTGQRMYYSAGGQQKLDFVFEVNFYDSDSEKFLKYKIQHFKGKLEKCYQFKFKNICLLKNTVKKVERKATNERKQLKHRAAKGFINMYMHT